MQLGLLKSKLYLIFFQLREDLIAAKVAKERIEEKLISDVGYLKSQLVSEGEARKVMEESLKKEIEGLKETIVRLQVGDIEILKTFFGIFLMYNSVL